MNPEVQSASVDAENEFTEGLTLKAGEVASISISGTFVADVELQRQLPGQTSWNTVQRPDGTSVFDAPHEGSYTADERCSIRLGVPTGSYTSGTAVCRVGKG